MMPNDATERSAAVSGMGDAAFHELRKPAAKDGEVLPLLTVAAALVVTAVVATTPPLSSRRRDIGVQVVPSAVQILVIAMLLSVTPADAGRPATMALLRIVCSAGLNLDGSDMELKVNWRTTTAAGFTLALRRTGKYNCPGPGDGTEFAQYC